MKDEAIKALLREMYKALTAINDDRLPFDGDDFHEALRLGEAAIAQPALGQNFCPRCGKRTPDTDTIHTCTPPSV